MVFELWRNDTSMYSVVPIFQRIHIVKEINSYLEIKTFFFFLNLVSTVVYKNGKRLLVSMVHGAKCRQFLISSSLLMIFDVLVVNDN